MPISIDEHFELQLLDLGFLVLVDLHQGSVVEVQLLYLLLQFQDVVLVLLVHSAVHQTLLLAVFLDILELELQPLLLLRQLMQLKPQILVLLLQFLHLQHLDVDLVCLPYQLGVHDGYLVLHHFQLVLDRRELLLVRLHLPHHLLLLLSHHLL